MRFLATHMRLVAMVLLLAAAAVGASVADRLAASSAAMQHREAAVTAGATIVPIVRVDNPSVVGKARRQNACDKCSLCLAKTGNRAEQRTLASIYDQGVYAYSTQQAAVNRCIANRFCRACEVKSVTYNLPATAFEPEQLQQIFSSTSFPSQAYLLNIVFDIVSRFCGMPSAAAGFTASDD